MRIDLQKVAEKLLLVLFLSSSLFFVLEIALRAYSYELAGIIIFTAMFCAGMVALAFVSAKLEKTVSIPVAALLIFFLYTASVSMFFNSIVLSLFLLGFPFAWLRFVEKKTFNESLQLLMVTRKGFLWNALLGFCLTLFLFYPIMFLEVVILKLVGITDVSNVSEIIRKAPLWLAVFSFTVAPVAEEFFFRGFLLPRIGIVASAVLFGLAHYAYSSVAEFLGAFTIGLLLGILLLRTRNIVSVIVAHITFNLISILIIYLGSWFG